MPKLTNSQPVSRNSVSRESISSTNDKPTLDQVVSLSKRRGFVFPTSEIYGGLANAYDYGPLGAQLLNNIRQAWWREFITNRPDMVGLDSAIILHPKTWVASGHVTSFSDPMVEDLVTNKRYRADHLIERWLEETGNQDVIVEDMTMEEMGAFLNDNHIQSPENNPISAPKSFNQLFETELGAISGEKSKAYLRGETAQGIFSDFKQVLDSSRVALPFGIGQLGKSFRNEITTGQFIFRTLEFEQGEIEYFFDPETHNWKELFQMWQEAVLSFVTTTLGINEDNLQWRQHTDKERSFYSRDTWDLEYNYSFGWSELCGFAYRTDYDLKQHQEYSGQKLDYRDPTTGKTFVPHVIEPAIGINRIFLMVLTDAYWEDKENNRLVLKLKPSIAPYQIAVFPLLKNKPVLVEKAKEVFKLLSPDFSATWDDRGNIGKRYLYQDEIGTPFCLTIDFDTLEDESVTVRDRDSMKQERVKISKLHDYLENLIKQ